MANTSGAVLDAPAPAQPLFVAPPLPDISPVVDVEPCVPWCTRDDDHQMCIGRLGYDVTAVGVHVNVLIINAVLPRIVVSPENTAGGGPAIWPDEAEAWTRTFDGLGMPALADLIADAAHTLTGDTAAVDALAAQREQHAWYAQWAADHLNNEDDDRKEVAL